MTQSTQNLGFHVGESKDASSPPPVPRPRPTHHGGLPFQSPGCPRVIIATQPRFICKPDFRSQLFGFLGNRRIFFLNPLPYPFGILLVGPPQGLLRSNSQ